MGIMTTIPAKDAVLGVLAEAETVRADTLARLLSGYSARQLSQALTSLFNGELIDAPDGRYDEYRLTPLGKAAAQSLPKENVLEQIPLHPGGSAYHSETGQVAIGLDGSGQLKLWRLWNEIGAVPGLVIGTSGAGGTNLLAGLIESTVPHYPDVQTWVVDSDHQMSEYWSQVGRVGIQNPADYPDYSPQPSSTADLLDQVISVQYDRNRILAQRGYRSWTLASGLPLGLLVFGFLGEIAHNRGLVERLGLITKMARKTGISIVGHANTPMIDSFGSPAIQEYFGTGNLALMRMSAKPLGRVIRPELADLPIIDRAFADGSTTAGLGYDENGNLFRTFWASGL